MTSQVQNYPNRRKSRSFWNTRNRSVWKNGCNKEKSNCQKKSVFLDSWLQLTARSLEQHLQLGRQSTKTSSRWRNSTSSSTIWKCWRCRVRNSQFLSTCPASPINPFLCSYGKIRRNLTSIDYFCFSVWQHFIKPTADRDDFRLPAKEDHHWLASMPRGRWPPFQQGTGIPPGDCGSHPIHQKDISQDGRRVEKGTC